MGMEASARPVERAAVAVITYSICRGGAQGKAAMCLSLHGLYGERRAGGDPAGLFAYPTSPYSALQERKTMTSKTIREPTRIVTAHRQREGAGFVVRRPFPTPGLDVADPFLLLDEMGPVDYGPGEAVGAPDHPHRGFETITYMLEGEFEHEDSAGHRGVLRPGD